MKKLLSFVICIAFLIPCISTNAATFNYQPKGVDIIFIVDHSNSMNANDKERLSLEMIKAFVDTTANEDIRVGYVAYNDKILSSIKPTAINKSAGKKEIKTLVSKTKYQGNTDIGLALDYAQGLVDKKSGRNSILLLLSDGETDLQNSNTGRTKADSNQDINQSIKKCKKNGVPIYTIAFGEKYDGSQSTLENIAEKTKAKMYKAKGPNDLINIFYDIMKKHTDIFVISIGDGVYAKGTQTLRYTLLNTGIDQATCLLVSPERIDQVKLYRGKEAIKTKRLTYYTVGNIDGITNDSTNISLQVNTAERQRLNAYLICKRDLIPTVTMENWAEKNEPLPFTIEFQKSDVSVTGAFRGKAVLYRVRDGKREKRTTFPIKPEGTMLSGTVSMEENGNYEVDITIKDEYQTFAIEPIAIHTVNNGPQGSFIKNFTGSTIDKNKTYNLDKYFTDQEGRELTYEIKEPGDPNIAVSTINGSNLTVETKQVGKTQISFTVANQDGEMQLIKTGINVVPMWQRYIGVIIGSSIVLLIILFYVRHNKKKYNKYIPSLPKAEYDFTGKINTYFTRTPEDVEIAPMTFALYQIKERQLRIGRLFEELKEVTKVLDLEQIYLTPGNDRTLLLSHNSSASLMIGNSIVCKNTAYRMSYGDVLYISLPEGDYELEIHYVSAMK